MINVDLSGIHRGWRDFEFIQTESGTTFEVYIDYEDFYADPDPETSLIKTMVFRVKLTGASGVTPDSVRILS